MALSTLNVAKIFSIYGIPQGGVGFEALVLTSLFGPAGEIYSFSAVVDALDARLTALSADQITLVEAAIVTWDQVGPTNIIEINKGSAGGEGIIVDAPRQQKKIRRYLSGIIGFAAPDAGFSTSQNNGFAMGVYIR